MKDGSCVFIGGEELYLVFVIFYFVNGRRLRVKFGYGFLVLIDIKSIIIFNLMFGKRILVLIVIYFGVVVIVYMKF